MWPVEQTAYPLYLIQIEGHTIWRPALNHQSIVLDLGANKGNFSHGILKQFNCHCYAVEANPHISKSIRHHQRLTVLNCAISTKSGKIPFYLSSNPEASSILTSTMSEPKCAIEVDSLCLQQIINRTGVRSFDLVKFDIEGAEIEILDSCSDDFLKSIGQMTIEFHDFVGLTSVAAIERLIVRLEALGYTKKMWRHAYGDTLFVNRNLTSAKNLKLAWSRYITRNLWGLKRVTMRTFK
jgi:FkbM family methyltransferase